MKKLFDGSPRSLRAIQVVKQSYSPRRNGGHHPAGGAGSPAEEARLLVESFAKMLPAFKTETALRFGKPGPEIVNFAKDGTFDSILMTRSSRGSTQKLGSVSHLRGAQRFLHHHHRSAGNLTHHPLPAHGPLQEGNPTPIVTQTGKGRAPFPVFFPVEPTRFG